MKKKKSIKKCNECPPEECCNCKDKINSVKENKKISKKRSAKRKIK